LLTAVTLILFAGVGAPSGNADAAFQWDRYAGSEIVVQMAEHPVTDGVQALIDKFQSDTGIKVDLETLTEDLYFDRMEVALRGSGGAANMDVYFLPMDSTAFTQHSAGLIHSLQTYLDDPEMTAADYDLADIPAEFLNATRYDVGGNWEYHGIPVSFETYILFYNKEHVDRYLGGQVPATMDALLEAANRVSEESGGRIAGASVRGIRSDTLIDTVTGMVFNSWGPGGSDAPYNLWFDGAWDTPRLNDPKIIKGLSNYARLMKAGPANIQAMDWPEASQLFQLGRAAFFIDASLFGPAFEDPENSAVAGRTGYAVLPVDNDSGDSFTAHWQWGLGIPQNAPNPQAAWYFIQWMTNSENEPAIGKFHGGAPRLSTWENPAYANSFNADYVAAVSAAMPNSRTSVVMREGWSEFALRIIDVVHAIYGGEEPAAAAAVALAIFKERSRH
jgi:multiple sugar transport system substrate-binding protein